MAVIETRGLRKTYGKRDSAFEALKGVDVAIEKGESIAIVGKSGSGKSTLMHLLALLDAPSGGKISVENSDAHSLKPKDLNSLRNSSFGFIFQQFFMNANETVLSNVLLPLKIGKASSRQRKALAMQAIEAVGLLEKAKNKAKDLSGGQKQRVCIARAIVNNPSVIFADEPTGNLDSETSEIIEELLFGLHKSKGITLIIVTHDPDLAAKCDRQIEVKDGRIVGQSDKRLEAAYHQGYLAGLNAQKTPPVAPRPAAQSWGAQTQSAPEPTTSQTNLEDLERKYGATPETKQA